MTDNDLELLDRAQNKPWDTLITMAAKAETKQCRDLLLDSAYIRLKQEERTYQY